ALDGSSRYGLRSRDGQARRHALARRDTRAIVGSGCATVRENLLELASLEVETCPSSRRGEQVIALDAAPRDVASRVRTAVTPTYWHAKVRGRAPWHHYFLFGQSQRGVVSRARTAVG